MKRIISVAGTEFVVAGRLDQAVPFVYSALESAGFRSTATGPGVSRIERGSLGKTVALGAFAGKNFHVSFILSFRLDERGNSYFRFEADGAGSAVKGGAIGYARSKKIFEEATTSIRNATAANNLLLFERSL
jgi:hypothetical protein